MVKQKNDTLTTENEMSEIKLMFLDEIRKISDFDFKDWVRKASSVQRDVWRAERFYRSQKRRLEDGKNSWGNQGVRHVGNLVDAIKTLQAELDDSRESNAR